MSVENTLYILILAYVFLFSITILISKKTVSRILNVVHIIFFMTIIAYLTSALTGYPRNIEKINQQYYFFEPSEFIVLDFFLEPDKNIYVWLLNHNNIPMSFRLDWDEDLAESLHQAQQQSTQTGAEIEIDFGRNNNQSNDRDQNNSEDNSSASVRTNQIEFFLKD